MLNKIEKIEKNKKNKNIISISLSKVLLISLIIFSTEYCVSGKTDPVTPIVTPPPIVPPVVSCNVSGAIKTNDGCICPVGQIENKATNSCEAAKVECSIQGAVKAADGICTCPSNSYSDGTKCIIENSRNILTTAKDIVFTKNRSITTIFWNSIQVYFDKCSIEPALPSGLFLATTVSACSIVGVPVELKEPTTYTLNWQSVDTVTSIVHSSMIININVPFTLTVNSISSILWASNFEIITDTTDVTATSVASVTYNNILVALTVNSISSILWASNFEIITDTTDVTVTSVASVTYNNILVTVISSTIWGSTYYYDVPISTLVYTTVQTSTFNIKVADLYKIFVTEAIYWGNLGGVSGVDNKCSVQATKKGLSGTYKAIISLSDANGGSRRACENANCQNAVDNTWVLKDRVNYFRTDETFIASSNKAGIFMPEDWINPIGTENDKYSEDKRTIYMNGGQNYTNGWNSSFYNLKEKPYAVLTGMDNGWLRDGDGNSSGIDFKLH